jgi:hypothetical protein
VALGVHRLSHGVWKRRHDAARYHHAGAVHHHAHGPLQRLGDGRYRAVLIQVGLARVHLGLRLDQIVQGLGFACHGQHHQTLGNKALNNVLAE